MDLDKLLQVRRSPQGRTHYMVCLDDVLDDLFEGADVISSSMSATGGSAERAPDRSRIDGRLRHVGEVAATAAAEIDPKPFEDRRGAKSAATISPTVVWSKSSLMSASHVSVSRGGPPRRRYDPRHMAERIDDALRRSAVFRRVAPDDRQRLAAVAGLREFAKGAMLFQEGDASESLYTVVTGRVKVFKTTPRGTDVILEIFGPGDPVGAVAVYESRPYPASAIALEPTECL
jgi:hypothetical protein